MLLVDDLQWVDPTSLRLLAALIERVHGLRVVLAYRPEEVEPGEVVADFLAHLGPTPLFRLGPLSESSLDDLVRDPDLAVALSRHTDRTPIALTEVLRRLASDGTISQDPDGRWHPAASNAAKGQPSWVGWASGARSLTGSRGAGRTSRRSSGCWVCSVAPVRPGSWLPPYPCRRTRPSRRWRPCRPST